VVVVVVVAAAVVVAAVVVVAYVCACVCAESNGIIGARDFSSRCWWLGEECWLVHDRPAPAPAQSPRGTTTTATMRARCGRRKKITPPRARCGDGPRERVVFDRMRCFNAQRFPAQLGPRRKLRKAPGKVGCAELLVRQAVLAVRRLQRLRVPRPGREDVQAAGGLEQPVPYKCIRAQRRATPRAAATKSGSRASEE
jgi:hypothetical protein